MSDRFFLAAPPVGGRAVLAGDEARHCSRVLRAKVGDAIRVFDGHGGEWQARIATIMRDEISLDIGEPFPASHPPALRLTLAVALPKGERQKWLVEKVTELGTARLVPLITARGVAEATAAARARLERGVIEACKQCGRSLLMEIAPPAGLDKLASLHPSATLLVADPGGDPLHNIIVAASCRDVIAAVGPEGGFTGDEIAAAEAAGFRRISLGPHILRIETAAIALAAWASRCLPEA